MSYKISKEEKAAYVQGYVDGQASGMHLSYELGKALLERAIFVPERLTYEIPQESYALAKLRLEQEGLERIRSEQTA